MRLGIGYTMESFKTLHCKGGINMDRWVIMNTKKRMTFEEAVIWFARDCTVVYGIRISERGAHEPVYILGASGHYGNIGSQVNYVTDTGNRYGGKGTISIVDEIQVKNGSYKSNGYLNLKEKRRIWVFK